MKLFDRILLDIKSLAERRHKLDISVISQMNAPYEIDKDFFLIAKRIIQAKRKKSAIILMAGAHIIRSGIQNYLIDLMKRGYISCIATNGAFMIHDFEFSLIGATCEDVAYYIKRGQFGLWKETSQINDVINRAYLKDTTIGMGEAVGCYIEESNMPYKKISILATCYRLKIPITIHVGIGYDIIHQHPNCDGRTTGCLSYNDFLRFVSIVQNLENGVIMNFGSAVMGPEVFLKALSMARNIALQKGKNIRRFTTLVCDLYPLPEDFKKEPSLDSFLYYFRPLKTMLIRTVADGGKSFYICGKHSETMPKLWQAINLEEKDEDT
ncbi:MAG: hypothetical protein AB1630_04500 [bacterium]